MMMCQKNCTFLMRPHLTVIMNMMNKILLISLCLLGCLLPVSAQQLDARGIMDKTADAFRKAGGVEAEFTVQTYSRGVNEGSSQGIICMKGEKFVLDAEGVKTWFDGRTQWSYLKNSDEVNVSEPTQVELQSINPYALLSIYKQGYFIEFGEKDTYNGRSAYEVVLLADNKRTDLQNVILYIAKDNLQPMGFSLTERGGSSVEVHIKSYKTGRKFDDAVFAFNKKAYPTAEVIDLR